MSNGRELLLEYVEHGSETAFRELVSQYVSLVYSTALRLTSGDSHLAQDVTQTVFIHLARQAERLTEDVLLGGWLHKTTFHLATKAVRAERRRQARETKALEMKTWDEDSAANLQQLTPILDEALTQLGPEDRDAILLRFFEQRDFRGVGAVLGSTEDAARMRVTRALEKLHAILQRRGVGLSVAALGGWLASQAVVAAPAGLAVSIAGAALAQTAAGQSVFGLILKGMAMTKLQVGITGAVVVISVATSWWIENKAHARLQEQEALLRKGAAQAAFFAAENQRLSKALAQIGRTQANDTGRERELLRLRAEVSRLRAELADAASIKKSASAETNSGGVTFTPEELERQEAIAKMGYTRNWLLAFVLYAQNNQGQFPTNFDQALPFLAEEAKVEMKLAPHEFLAFTPKYGLTPDRFEIMYQGPVAALQNPVSTIVLREKDPWWFEGSLVKAYGFADGHSEVHKALDGKFDAWEKEHLFGGNN